VILLLLSFIVFVMAGALVAAVAIAAASLVILTILALSRTVWQRVRPTPSPPTITFDSLRLTSPAHTSSWPRLSNAFLEGVLSK
jgi:hypothetical protein